MYFKFHWSEKTMCVEEPLKVTEAQVRVKFEASRSKSFIVKIQTQFGKLTERIMNEKLIVIAPLLFSGILLF